MHAKQRTDFTPHGGTEQAEVCQQVDAYRAVLDFWRPAACLRPAPWLCLLGSSGVRAQIRQGSRQDGTCPAPEDRAVEVELEVLQTVPTHVA